MEPEQELEEDNEFISWPPSYHKAHAFLEPEDGSRKQQVAVEDGDDDLQEDDAFFRASNPHSSIVASIPSPAPSATPPPPDFVPAEEELEEDLAFAAPNSSQVTHLSSPTRLSITRNPRGDDSLHSTRVEMDDDQESDSLPNVSQLIRSVTGRNVDVSRLDLGIRTVSNRQICGTSYSGRRLNFKRTRGNALVGEVRTFFLYD